MTGSAAFDSLKKLAARLQSDDGHRGFWPEVELAARTCIGYQFMTALAIDHSNGRMVRLHSTASGSDRVGGTKAMTDGEWTSTIVHQGNVLIGSDRTDLARIFSNHQQIVDAGCESSLNVPIRSAGKTIGSLNLFAHAHAYDKVELPVVLCLAQLLAAPVAEALRSLPPPDPADIMEPL